MPGLQESLRKVLDEVEGVQTAALIDIATGMVVRSVGKAGTELPAAAALVADEARVARDALGADRHAGDLDEIAVVTATRIHLSKMLRPQPGEGLLLFVDLERSKSNVGLAWLQVRQAATAVLA